MPTRIDIESVWQRWQDKYNRILSDDKLIEMAKIPMASLRRIRSGTMSAFDLPKILPLCRALECDPIEIIAH